MRFGGHRQPARLDVLARVVEPGGGIIDIVEHRIARDHAGEQRMAVARVRLVVGIVAGQPDEAALVGRFELDRAAPRPDILVVVVDAEVEVVAETAARQPRTPYPDLEQNSEARRRADDAGGLLVTALGRTEERRGGKAGVSAGRSR